MLKVNLILWALLAISASAFAQGNPPAAWDWRNDPRVPLCPDTGARILDDTYPAIAQVIGTEFAPQFVRASLSDPTSSHLPRVVIQASDAEFSSILSQVRPEQRLYVIQDHWNPDDVQRPYENPWYQDFFESFFSPSTGAPVLARLSTDDEEGDDVTQLQARSIARSLHRMIPSSSYIDEFVDWDRTYGADDSKEQTAGGDIDALPGGLCLHGNQEPWNALAKKYCGRHENEVILDNTWLTVGHVDEIVSVIPTAPAGTRCGFAIGMPSPHLALSLVRDKDWNGPYLSGHLKKMNLSRSQVVAASRMAEQRIESDRSLLEARLKRTFPDCTIPFVWLPVLFQPQPYQKLDPKDWRKTIEVPAVTAFTANLANAVKQGRTYIAEDPVLPRFRDTATQALQSVGVRNVRWIQHDMIGRDGSIHCASHTIRVCRPRPASSLKD